MLITADTQRELWCGLVKDGEQWANVTLQPSVEAHLASSLELHSTDKAPDLLSRIFGEEGLRLGLKKDEYSRSVRAHAYSELADACLLVAGLFPARAKSKHVSPGYFVWLAASSYASAAGISWSETRSWYEILERNTIPMLRVLRYIRRRGRARAERVLYLVERYVREVEIKIIFP